MTIIEENIEIRKYRCMEASVPNWTSTGQGKIQKVSSKYALGQDKIVKCSIYSCFYGYLGSKTLSKRGSNLI